MTASRKLIGYLGAFLGCISLGLIGAPFAIQLTRLCDYPNTIAGQICRGKVPQQVPENAWGNAGSVAYQTAAQLMAKKNAAPQELDEIQKYFLRPHFGDLVDRVQVVYNAQLVDDWIAASFRIDVGHSNAQVYGNRIYIKEAYKADDIQQLILLAHELIHVRQYEELGSLEEFGYQYFQEYKRADQSYRENVFEQEAFAFEDEFEKWLEEDMRQYDRY
ncbi:MAG: DUF4157 domain-containing protein [Geitlerinemataceae cyanobacterium]